MTAEDVANGIPRKCKKCPLALAATRHFGSEATVIYFEIELEDGRYAHDAWEKVIAFDRDGVFPVGPVRVMRVPDSSN